MTKVAYFDCPTGIAGDMCLGAMIDAGVPLDHLIQQLSALGIADEYTLRAESVQRNGQRATKLHVNLAKSPVENGIQTSHGTTQAQTSDSISHRSPSQAHSLSHDHSHDHSHPHDHDHRHDHSHRATRHLPEIETLIHSASLSSKATEWSLAIFRQLAKAEGAVHGIPPDQVHFHEVGATDAIVDIVGTCIGLAWFGIEQVYCSALPTGGGTVWAAHGRLPVPAPAVLHLLQMGQVPIYSNGINRELVTPTGAAIATTLATAFGSPPAMTLQTIGLGAGGRDLEIPNILRLWLGELTPSSQNHHASSTHAHPESAPSHDHASNHRHTEHPHDNPSDHHHQPQSSTELPLAATEDISTMECEMQYDTETIAVLETHLDDLNPQIMGYVFDRLLAIGALDVFTQSVGMKKSRPGILLTVLCLPDQIPVCEAIIYRETTTLGIRHRLQERSLLYREFHSVTTAYGNIPIKLGFDRAGGTLLNVKPEYEDCARLAQQHHIPLADIYETALHSFRKSRRPE